MREMFLVGAVPVLSLSLALGLSLVMQGRPGPVGAGAFVVVLPPWQGAEAVVARAGGILLPQPRAALGILAAGPGPDFPGRLRAAGALLVLAPTAGDSLCGA
jgi:hypothetical protein